MQRLILSVLLLASLTKAQQATNLFSSERESALGSELSSQARSQYTFVRTASVGQFVDRVGRRLTAALPDAGTVYRFTVVEDRLGGSTNEPVALPGGFIFVPANLISESRSESELAGMLAHAIAHVAARHTTRLATRAAIENVEFLPAMYLNLSLLATGDSRLLELQRGFEAEADQVAVAMMAAVGYDPAAFAAYIARQQRDGETQGNPLPPRDERVLAILRGIQQLPQNDLGQVQEELRK
jgi:beta-barrel assembly-enhancing protease